MVEVVAVVMVIVSMVTQKRKEVKFVVAFIRVYCKPR